MNTSRTSRVLLAAAIAVGMCVWLAPPSSPASPRAGAAPASASASASFVALTPARILDTRSSLGATRVAARGTLRLQVLGRAGIPKAGVSAVTMSLTATATTAAGYLSAYADGTSRPTASTLNFARADTVSNHVVVPVGANGRISIFNGAAGPTQVVGDVFGYFATTAGSPAGSYVPTVPSRILDTRTSAGSLPARGSRAVAILGRGPVPTTGVSAVALNVTALAPGAAGSLTVHPTGGPVPAAANVTFAAGATRADAVVVPVGTNGTVTVDNSSTGPTGVLVDVAGYYRSGTAGPTGAFVPVAPTRLARGRIAPRNTLDVDTTANDPLPAQGVSAVLLDVTVSGASASGYITPAGASVSALNFRAGQPVSTLVLARLGSADYFGLTNGSSASYAQIDATLVGYYARSPGAGSIAGTVTNSATGAGVPGVVVRLYDGDVDYAEEYGLHFGLATTDANGRYTVAGVWSGMTYSVCFDSRAATGLGAFTTYVSECYDNVAWDNGDVPDQITPVPVTTGAVTTGIDAQLDPVISGGIAGRVTDAGGSPIAGVDVTFSPGGVSTVTGSDGRYSVSTLTPRTYTVAFQPGSVTGGSAPFGYLAATGGPVTVTAGQIAPGVNATLQAKGVISGTVRTSTGARISNGYAVAFASGLQYEGTINASDGTYSITDLPPGRYPVCFSSGFPAGTPSAPYGFASECNAGVGWPTPLAAPPSGVTPVDVPSGAQVTVNATLPQAGAISGTVTSAVDGSPLDRIDVTVSDPSNGSTVLVRQTGSAGHYVVPDLAALASGYTVCFDDPQLRRPAQCWRGVAWDGASGAPNGTTPVSVSSGAMHSGIDVAL